MAYHSVRTITTLNGVCQLLLKIRRCHNRACEHYRQPYRPEEEFLLFFQGKIVPSSASPAWCFNRRDAEKIVTGDYRVNRCFGYTTVPRDLRGCPWLNQGVVNTEIAVLAQAHLTARANSPTPERVSF